MTLDEYQEFVKSTSIVGDHKTYWYSCLGIAGEAGEVIEHIKKSARKDFKDIEKRKPELKLELGDVIWYVARLCNELDLRMVEVLDGNVVKLTEKNRLLGPTYA